MSWVGKIVGLFLGSALGGPLGAIFGVILGHFYDLGYFRRWFGTPHGAFASHAQVQRAFFSSSFQIMGYIAKSDGRVSESEIAMARQIMQQMLLNEALKHEAMQLFNQGKKADFDLDTTLDNLREACHHHPSLLRVFLELQLQMALAETGNLTVDKRRILQFICARLGVVGIDFTQFEQRARAEQNYTRHSASLSDAYRILGLNSRASDEEVKLAYRRLMNQNHPDKLMAKGLPPEMLKVATRKTQQIKQAYEQIKQARKL